MIERIVKYFYIFENEPKIWYLFEIFPFINIIYVLFERDVWNFPRSEDLLFQKEILMKVTTDPAKTLLNILIFVQAK